MVRGHGRSSIPLQPVGEKSRQLVGIDSQRGCKAVALPGATQQLPTLPVPNLTLYRYDGHGGSTMNAASTVLFSVRPIPAFAHDHAAAFAG